MPHRDGDARHDLETVEEWLRDLDRKRGHRFERVAHVVADDPASRIVVDLYIAGAELDGEADDVVAHFDEA